MKKFFSLELVILLFFAAGIARCEDSFYTGVSYDDSKNKMAFPVSKNIQEAQAPQKEAKKGFFAKFLSNKIKKNDSKNSQQGYWGTLPDIKGDFNYKKQNYSTKSEIDGYIPKEDLKDEDLKPAPYNDTLFLDVIVKKDKASNYVNDIQKIKLSLTNLKKCIEEQGDIQRFNGCVNMIELQSKSLQNKYENKSESLKESYNDILNTNYYAKVLGNLLYESNYYARYIPTQSGKYSKENIENQKQVLLKRINKTLFLIANEN